MWRLWFILQCILYFDFLSQEGIVLWEILKDFFIDSHMLKATPDETNVTLHFNTSALLNDIQKANIQPGHKSRIYYCATSYLQYAEPH